MCDLGYVEGQNILVEFRSTNQARAAYRRSRASSFRMPVDVLVVGGGVSAQYAKTATTTVPIVFTTVGDPVGIGLVASLSRPGGNATGMSNLQSELGAKQLELLKEVAPRIARVAVLYNPGSPISAAVVRGVQDVARPLAIELLLVDVRHPDEVPSVLSALAVQAWRMRCWCCPIRIRQPLAKIAQATQSSACRRSTRGGNSQWPEASSRMDRISRTTTGVRRPTSTRS